MSNEIWFRWFRMKAAPWPIGICWVTPNPQCKCVKFLCSNSLSQNALGDSFLLSGADHETLPYLPTCKINFNHLLLLYHAAAPTHLYVDYHPLNSHGGKSKFSVHAVDTQMFLTKSPFSFSLTTCCWCFVGVGCVNVLHPNCVGRNTFNFILFSLFSFLCPSHLTSNYVMTLSPNLSELGTFVSFIW